MNDGDDNSDDIRLPMLGLRFKAKLLRFFFLGLGEGMGQSSFKDSCGGV